MAKARSRPRARMRTKLVQSTRLRWRASRRRPVHGSAHPPGRPPAPGRRRRAGFLRLPARAGAAPARSFPPGHGSKCKGSLRIPEAGATHPTLRRGCCRFGLASHGEPKCRRKSRCPECFCQFPIMGLAHVRMPGREPVAGLFGSAHPGGSRGPAFLAQQTIYAHANQLHHGNAALPGQFLQPPVPVACDLDPSSDHGCHHYHPECHHEYAMLAASPLCPAHRGTNRRYLRTKQNRNLRAIAST